MLGVAANFAESSAAAVEVSVRHFEIVEGAQLSDYLVVQILVLANVALMVFPPWTLSPCRRPSLRCLLYLTHPCPLPGSLIVTLCPPGPPSRQLVDIVLNIRETAKVVMEENMVIMLPASALSLRRLCVVRCSLGACFPVLLLVIASI